MNQSYAPLILCCAKRNHQRVERRTLLNESSDCCLIGSLSATPSVEA